MVVTATLWILLINTKKENKMNTKSNGKVKWFNEQKGYGFIEMPHQSDLFVHISDVNKAGFKNLKEGQIIFFDVETKGSKSKAVNIQTA